MMDGSIEELDVLEVLKERNKELYDEVRFWFIQNPQYKKFSIITNLTSAINDVYIDRKVVQFVAMAEFSSFSVPNEGLAISILFTYFELHTYNHNHLPELIERKLKEAIKQSIDGMKSDIDAMKKVLYFFAHEELQKLNSLDIFKKLIA